MGQFMTGGGRRNIPGQAVPITGPGIGTASTEALGRMGATVADAALQVAHDQTMALRQQQDERQRLFSAAEGQREALEMDKASDHIRALHDEIGNQLKAGQVPKDQAESLFAERAKKIADEVLPQMRPQSQDLARRHIERAAMTLGTSMRRMVDDQARHEVTAGMQSQLETLQREYRNDPAKATAMAAGIIETQGPFSNLSAEQRGKLLQSWKEKTQFTTAFDAVSAGRYDRKQLDAAEKLIGTLPDLDPEKRSVLVDRVQTYRAHIDQQDEMRAQRAQREWERRLTMAKESYNVMRDIADKGTVLDPAYVDDVMRQTQGTPYQAGIVALAKQARETGGFAAQPIAVQRATLQALDADIAKNGRTPELDKRREQLAKVLTGSEGDLAKDGLQAGLQRGVITSIAPLSLAGGIAGLSQQLAARSEQASTVQAWAGRPVSPLTKQEADSTAALLRTMPADQRATALEAIAGRMTPQQAQAFAAQMDGSDNATALALAYGARQTTFDRPVSELILRGQIALKEAKTVKLDDKAEEGLTAQLDKALGGAIANPQQAQQVRDAAKLIWAGKASEGNRIDPENALRLALGGHVVEHNGAKVVASLNIDSGELQQRLAKYPEAALTAQLPDGKVYVRGQPMEAAAFLKTLPGAKLRTLARDRFAVMSGEAFVTNSQAVPVVLEVGNAR